MNFLINERLQDFFLGDDTAWDDITLRFYDRLLERLEKKFSNISFEDLQDIVSDKFTDIFIEVSEEINKAELEGKIKNLSTQEINKLKISRCIERMKFDFTRGVPFEAWLWRGLIYRAIDFYRKKGRRSEESFDAENYQNISVNPWTEMSDAEIVRLMNKLKAILSSALEENELLYFQIWCEYGNDPNSKLVREIFKQKLGKEISDATVTNIKQRFLRISYLTLLEFVRDANALSGLFRRLIDSKDDEYTFFADMMKIIWQVFYNDNNVREQSRRKISPDLWKRWEQLVQKTNIQNQILVKAYHYFKAEKPPPSFIRTTEIYANIRFGKKVRELFLNGGAANEDE